VSKNSYKMCTRCVMDTEGTDIEFDENGVCMNVHAFLKDRSRLLKSDMEREAALEKIIARIKKDGEGHEYDCVVGVSGGVDSTYVIYQAKKLSLRPLAIHVDNGWNSELAVQNIENAIKTLNVDLYTHVIDWTEFRDLQVSFLKASVSDAELPSDHANRAVLMKVAAKKNIKYSLTGRNLATEGLLGNNWTYSTLDWKYINAIQKCFGSIKLKSYPHLSLFDILYNVAIRRISDISILNYLPYNQKDVLETLEKELGYRRYAEKHYESIYTRFFQSYILPKKFNIDKRKAHLSVLILTGQITRKEAIEALKKSQNDLSQMEEDKEFVQKKLGLDIEKLDSIMNLPIKKFSDYPNNSQFFKFYQHKRLIALVRFLKVFHVFPKEFASRSAGN